MSAAGFSIAIKNPSAASGPFDFRTIPPALVKRDVTAGRTKIWEFSTHLHCSIIGTCLSTVELRQVLRKFVANAEGRTDHELHSIAVTLAGRHDDAARQLHKALDRRHKLAVSQFAKADTEDTLRALWRASVRRGDIPGAYWATLTHSRANQTIVREAFGDVHMLSHLVGSANRADIKRLCELEADKAALEEKVARQQQALHEAVVERDTQIRALRDSLTQRIASQTAETMPETAETLHGIVRDLERRLAAETRRRAAVEVKLADAQEGVARERSARVAAIRECEAMRRELDAIETSLAAVNPGESLGFQSGDRMDGVTLLYVGGRPNQVAPMKAAVERLGANLLHHDGGVENHQNLLPGLVSRAIIVLFPVDCISHDAANAVKSLCRHGGKRFIPLRSASITSLLVALQGSQFAAAPAAAE